MAGLCAVMLSIVCNCSRGYVMYISEKETEFSIFVLYGDTSVDSIIQCVCGAEGVAMNKSFDLDIYK